MLDVLKVKIKDEEKSIRPSIKALRNIEDALGLGIGEIGQKMSTGQINLNLIVETMYFGLEAAGNKIPRNEIEQELETRGLDCFNEAILGFFLQGTLGEARASEVLGQLKTQQASV